MPGIFVDPNSTFPITIYYRAILDAKGNEVTTDVWASEDDDERPEGDGWRSMTVRFRQVDMGSFGSVLEEATIINHVNQKPTLRTKMLREQVLANYIASWDVGRDGHGGWENEEDIIPVNVGLLLKSHWKVGNKLFIEYMVRSRMMDAVRRAMEDEGGDRMGQPTLSSAVWATDSGAPPFGGPQADFPGFPQPPGFPQVPGFPQPPGFPQAPGFPRMPDMESMDSE